MAITERGHPKKNFITEIVFFFMSYEPGVGAGVNTDFVGVGILVGVGVTKGAF